MDLTWALAGLAAALLAALAFHGWWLTRRTAARPSSPQSAGSKLEPALDAEGADRFAGSSGNPLEPVVETVVLTRRSPSPRLDALIDAIVSLRLEAPVTGEFLLMHLPAGRHAGTKLFLIEALEPDTGQWEPPEPGRRYAELQAGVQLASRSGALNEIEYSEFLQKVESFAEAVGAVPEVPDMLEVMARARELDALTAPLDAQLTVTLRAHSVAWSVGFIQQCAARHGFVAGVLPGRLVVPGAQEGAPPVLVLGFDAQAALAEDPQSAPVRECTLTLEVVHTPEEVEAFPAWHEAARQLADEMGAVVVDDEGRPVTLHAFAAIGTEVRSLYRRLEALDLAAGSPAARRLFS